MIDLLLKDAEALDPGTGLRGRRHIAIEGGRVARIAAPRAKAVEAQRTIDLRGRLTVPGLIDLHAHVYHGVVRMNIDADLVGVLSGVTTIMDCGSAGCYTFIPPHLHPPTRTRLFYLLHIARTGLAFTPELRTLEDVNYEATVALLHRYPDILKGVKIRAIKYASDELGMEAVRLAKRAARETGTRFMMHIGDPMARGPVTLTRKVLPLLEPGDIITHCFTGQPGGLLGRDGRPLPEALDAYQRGVVFDAAHGMLNFHFDAARRLLDAGILPHVVSSDIHGPTRHRIVYGLTDVMSKFLALGFTVEDVVRLTTKAPAKLLGMDDRIGSLREGSEADITVLDVVAGKWRFRDAHDNAIVGDKALVPLLTVRAGEPITPDWGPYPQGWLPEEA